MTSRMTKGWMLLLCVCGVATAASAPPVTVTITSTSPLPQGFTSIPYTFTFTGTTNVVGAAITWSLVPTNVSQLPAGFALSGTGVLSGTTTQTGTFTFGVNAQVGNTIATGTFSLTIAASSITINTPAALTNGFVSQPYSVALSATSNPPGVTWFQGESQLPPGLNFSSAGVLSGTPTTPGAFQFSLTAEITGTAVSASRTFTVTIFAGQLTINTNSLPFAFSGQLYSTTLSGTPSGITWAVTGALPAGITLNAATGVLSGTTTAVGIYPLQFQANETNYVGATRSLTLDVTNGPLTISPSTLPPAVQGSPYQTTVVGSGGLPPFQWSLNFLGLSINAQSGVITGTPQSSGSFVVPVTLSDATGQSLTQNLSLFVATPLSVATASLPPGTVGTAYSQSLLQGGGVSPYTWIVVQGSGSLPTGLALSSSGVISGTPTAAGTFNFKVQVTDAGGRTAMGALTIVIGNGVQQLTITTVSLPNAQVSVPYSQTLTASGGVAPYKWTILAGALPQGLSLSSDGTIGGTPTAIGQSSFTVQVADSSPTAPLTAQKVFGINTSLVLSITTVTLPGGTIGVAYSQTLAASGGTTPYTWSIASGSLPPGLQLNASTGVISGTPTANGTSAFTMMVSDAGGRTATGALSISIGVTAAVTITTASLPNGQLTVPYSQTLAASGGVAPYKWSKASGTLPPGLTLNSNGTITGTPTGPLGTSSFTIQVSDSSPTPLTAQKAFTINISLTLTITTASLPGGTVGTPYSQTLAGSGGTTPYTWSISSGALPAGLKLTAASGVISGTPTTVGASTFTMTLTDASALTAQQQLSIAIAAATAPPSITTGNLSATVGTAFSQTLAATGGTPPFTWSITSGTLPAGLQLNNGVISGTPTAAGMANVTLKVTDSQQQTATATISITVSLPPAPAVSIGAVSSAAGAQPPVSLALSSSVPVAVAGTLSVSFKSAVGGSPSEVQFVTPSGGASSVNFSVPAGATNAVFANAPVLVTGTVAGTITLTATLTTEGGVPITPTPAPTTETIVIAPSAPVIQSVSFSNTGGSLTVTVIGFSTTREIVSGQFQFAPATGSTLSQSTVGVQLGPAFLTWFQSTASNQFGGQFMLTMPFGVAGTAADVVSVSVSLTNAVGASAAVSPH